MAVGTKCNTLLTVDTRDMTVAEVPLPRPRGRSAGAEVGHCGIHCMALSPGGDMLATGGAEPADCTVLQVASMQPVQTLVVSPTSPAEHGVCLRQHAVVQRSFPREEEG